MTGQPKMMQILCRVNAFLAENVPYTTNLNHLSWNLKNPGLR